MKRGRTVGSRPWLPWPLSAWPWWTEPVRAERLAVLRIGLAAVLLVDLVTSYLPHVDHYFATDFLGSAEVLESYWGRSSNAHWSLLRGVEYPLESALFLAGWGIATCLVLIGLWGRMTIDPDEDPKPDGGAKLIVWSLLAWIVTGVLTVLGVWLRALPGKQQTLLWLVPLFFWLVSVLFVMLEVAARLRGYRRERDAKIAWLIGISWALMLLLALGGLWLKVSAEDSAKSPAEIPAFLQALFAPWNDSHVFLMAAMILFIAATASLLLGFWTRTSAVIAWALSTSFASLNPYIDNAGDSVRGIILFYLMLCPCGAAWSIDAWWAKRRAGPARQAAPAFVYPWALRLLFVQMVFIYFCNGVYKVVSGDWLQGDTLYYVLRDLVLTRFSYDQLQVPRWMTKLMTWTVLAWEFGFPLWIAIPWTRKAALFFGVAFHLGIGLTMELGGFVPYMLVLYLPLLPWERWLARDRRKIATVEIHQEMQAIAPRSQLP